MNQYNTSRSSRHKSPAHYRTGSRATYSAQIAYRGNLSGRATWKETNPAYTNEAAIDEDMEKETGANHAGGDG